MQSAVHRRFRSDSQAANTVRGLMKRRLQRFVAPFSFKFSVETDRHSIVPRPCSLFLSSNLSITISVQPFLMRNHDIATLFHSHSNPPANSSITTLTMKVLSLLFTHRRDISGQAFLFGHQTAAMEIPIKFHPRPHLETMDNHPSPHF